jgi:hypothetical protein
MASLTLLRVASRTLGAPLITRDTVIGDTPAWRATTSMVGADWRAVSRGLSFKSFSDCGFGADC